MFERSQHMFTISRSSTLRTNLKSPQEKRLFDVSFVDINPEFSRSLSVICRCRYHRHFKFSSSSQEPFGHPNWAQSILD